MNKSVRLTLFLLIMGVTALSPAKAQEDLVYVAVDPCRIIDTREAGGAITANTFRNFLVSGSLGELAVQGGKIDCLDPKAGTGQNHMAISAYVYAVPAKSSAGGGVLTAYPSDQLPPPVGTVSTVNFSAGQIIGNTTNVTLCDPAGCPTDGEFAIFARNTDQHVVVDVQGYFYTATLEANTGTETAPVSVKANGQRIGRLVDNNPQASHPFPPDTLLVLSDTEYLFELNRSSGQVVNFNGDLLFELPDCAGRVYPNVAVRQGTVINFQDTDEPGLYYFPEGLQLVEVDTQSVLSRGGGEEFCSHTGAWVAPLQEMLPNDPAITAVSNTPYAAPLTLGY